MLKITELYTLSGWIVRYVNYISIKLFLKKIKPKAIGKHEGREGIGGQKVLKTNFASFGITWWQPYGGVWVKKIKKLRRNLFSVQHKLVLFIVSSFSSFSPPSLPLGWEKMGIPLYPHSHEYGIASYTPFSILRIWSL